MVKSELIAALQKRMPDMMLRDVELAINAILEQIAEALETGERIEVRGFGAFSLHQHPARTGRNPKTCEPVHVPSRSVVHFNRVRSLGVVLMQCVTSAGLRTD